MEPRHGILLLSGTCKAALPVLLALVLLLAARAVPAKTYARLDETLERSFGEAQVTRRTAFLTPAQVARVKQLGRVGLEQARVTFWEARTDSHLVARGYLETDRVRTMNATLWIVLDAQGITQQVEVLAFHEPEDYLPPRRWYQRLLGRKLSTSLAPGVEVDAISGATLTVRAACAAVRRVLAIDEVLHGDER